MPILGQLPLYTVGSFFFRELDKGTLTSKASSLAYNFMLAIFPAIIFLFTLIPYIPITHFQDRLLSLIALTLPQDAFSAVESTLNDIIKKQHGKLLSIGFVSALVLVTNGVHDLMEAFNKSSLIIETRTWLRQRWIALVLTMLMVGALILGLAIITATEYVIAFLRSELFFQDSFWIHLIAVARWIILMGMYFTTIAILYRYGPATVEKGPFFSVGAFLALIFAGLTFLGFAYYINHFSTYNKVYGSIGTLIVIMVWVYLNSYILLLGFEFNVSIDLSKRSIKIPAKSATNVFKNAPVDFDE